MSLGAANSAAAISQSLNTPMASAGAANGSPPRPKDRTEPETAAQFGETLQNVQAKYGAKPEKGREIKKTLGKDDFLRIMITQMKNQDPTNPFKAEQMASEMAQFTTVEQLKNMNESLGKMTTANQPLERMAMTGMIGKTVTVDRSRFPHTEGTNDTLSYGLPKDAASVTVAVLSEQGETVFQKDLGKVKAGEGNFIWDGKKANSLPAKAGNYMLRVEARDENGQLLETNPTTQARVIGVSFEGSEPVFLIGDNKHQEKVTMKSVVRIESTGDAAGAPGQALGVPPAASGAGLPKAAPNFFTYQKGVGSNNLDTTQSPGEVRDALARYQAGGSVSNGAAPVQAASGASAPTVARPVAQAQVQSNSEKGFPNGLHDDSQTGDNQKGGKNK